MAISKLNRALVLSTVVLAAGNGYWMWRLDQARVRVTSGEEGAAELRAKVADLERERQRLQHELQVIRAANGSRTAGRAESAEASDGVTPATGRLTRSLGPVLPVPELPREHRTTAARLRYGRLLHELGISEQDIDTLLPVLSEIDAASESAGSMPLAFGLTGLQGDPELARRRAAVAAVVGEEKADRFERLVKAIPLRSEVGLARVQLESMGVPMTPQQQQKLLALMSERAPRTPPTMPSAVDFDQSRVAWQAWRKETNQRFLDEAATVLTPRQHKLLQESQAMNEAMMASVSIGSNQGGAGSAP